MAHGRATVMEQKSLFKKFAFWVMFFGLAFVIGSVAAQNAENVETSEEAVKKEAVTTDKSNDEENATSDSSEKDDESASTASTNEEADTTKDKKAVKTGKEEADPEDAKEKAKKKNPETGSHLPNGDPTSNVIRLTGDAVRDFYYRLEYLRW